MKKKYFLIFFFSITKAFSTSYNFEDALERIIQRDTSIPTQESQVESSESSYLSNKLSFLPTLTASFSQNKELERNTKAESRRLTARLNIFNGGSDYFNLMAGRYGLRFQKTRLKAVKLSTEREAIEGLISFIRSKKNLNILREQEKIRKASYRLARQRFKRGLTARQEVDKAKVDFLNSKAVAESALISHQGVEATLFELLGSRDLKDKWPWIKKLSEIKASDIKNISVDVNKNLDTKASKLFLLSQKELKKSRWSSFLPEVNFSYTLGEQTQTQLTNQLQFSGASTLLSVSLPLFDGWSRVAAIRQAEASLAQAKQSYRRSGRQTKGQWEGLKRQLIFQLKTAKERNQTLKISRRLYRDNFKRFQKGLVTINDLQLDQNRLLDSENLTNSGWAEAHLTYVNFCHLQGLSVWDCVL